MGNINNYTLLLSITLNTWIKYMSFIRIYLNIIFICINTDYTKMNDQLINTIKMVKRMLYITF
jgi:hypothetical protein